MARPEQKLFDPDSAFFVISSDRLDGVQSAFYGFTFAEDGTVMERINALLLFVNREGRIIRLNREQPEFYHTIQAAVQQLKEKENQE